MELKPAIMKQMMEKQDSRNHVSAAKSIKSKLPANKNTEESSGAKSAKAPAAGSPEFKHRYARPKLL